MIRTRGFYVLAGVVLVLLCGAPIVMGFVIERVYSQVIEEVNQRSDGQFWVVGEFSQGLWTSSAKTRVQSENNPKPIVLDQHFIHGPVPLAELARGRSPWAWVLTVLETQYESDRTVSTARREESVENFHLESVLWVHFDRSARLNLNISEWELPGLSLRSLKGRAVTSGSGLSTGSFTLERAVMGEGAMAVADGVTLSILHTPLEGGLETVELEVGVDNFEMNGTRFESGELIAAGRRVDLGSVMELNAAFSLLDTVGLSEEEALLARSEVLATHLPRVLRGSPELEISTLSFSSGSEALNGSARVSVDGSDPSLLAIPLFLMGLVQADAEVVTSAGILEKGLDDYLVSNMLASGDAEGLSEADLREMASFMREAVLETLLGEKRLVREEDEFRLDLEFDGGLLILNGEMVDPAELSSPLSTL